MPPKKTAAKKSAPKKGASAKKPASKKASPKKSPAGKTKTTPTRPAAMSGAKKKAPTPKKAKSSPKSSAVPAAAKISNKSSSAAHTTYAQWFWEGDNGQWNQYEVKQNQVMEDTYQRHNGTGVVELAFNNWKYDIDLDSMLQVNKSTRRQRKMKREMTKATSATIQKSKESASGKRQRTVQKGNGVVDPLSGKVDTCHVYEDGNGCAYQCTLNQTNISTNNNKFYILQLLEEDSGPGFYLFTRWGRVGVDGQMLTEQFANLSAAVAAFKKKFSDKTRNDWDSRANFTKVPGKYFLMQIDYTGDKADDADDTTSDGGAGKRKSAKTEGKAKASGSAAAPASPVTSTLPLSVQQLMKMIGSKDAMTSTMKELDIDTSRMPLGKISKPQIKQAYSYLQTIEKELKKTRPNVEEATALFYTLIPHDFGFRRPPLINTEEMLKEKIELLDTLGQLEIAVRLLDSGTQQQVKRNPLDEAYDKLACSITPLAKTCADFKRIVQYVKNTQGRTHTTFGIEVDEVFALSRSGEKAKYSATAKSVGNRHLLWHGSRTTNYMGILSQGLRIAPPEAPVTGYMFGKGIYFADCCSKSANYCQPTRTSNTGLMLLCDVALGKEKALTSAQYMLKPPAGFHSTKGVGSMRPDEKGYEKVGEVTWPMGKMKSAGGVSTTLLYPEYIVYDTNQCAMEYLVKMKFNFK